MDQTPLQTGSARRFRFLECIGKGGFGEVYLAEMSTSSGFVKTVAIKVLREDVQEHEQVASRLRDEAKLLGMLRHPAIVKADDLINIAGRPAVVMEYVPGVNFSWLINPKRCKTRMPPSVAMSIVRQVASALYAAYERPSRVTGQPLKVLHRDIKPGNIRITMDGEVKVLDFGIARSEHQDREAETQNYQLGSLRYMSPELMSGRGASPSSDVYALGVVAFEALARKRLGWAGEAPDVHDNQVQSRLEAADLTAFPGESWNKVIALLESMLAYDPDGRPSANDIVDQCRELEAAVPGPALEVWAREVLPTVIAPEEPKDADLSGQTLWEEGSAVTKIEPQELELDATEEHPKDAVLRNVDAATPLRFALWAGLAAFLALVLAGGWWFAFGREQQSRRAEERADPPTTVQTPPTAVVADPEPPPSQPPTEPEGGPEADPEELPATADASPNGVTPAAPPEDDRDPPVPSTTTNSPTNTITSSAQTTTPTQSEPTPAPAPSAEPIKVRFGSVPFGLMVYLDGTLVGKTPKTAEVTPGTHVLMFVDGERTQREEITVEPGGKTIWTYNTTRGNVQ